MEILQIGYVGLGGTLEILKQNEERLLTRFSPGYLRPIYGYEKELLLEEFKWKQICQMIGNSGIIHPIHDGGILTALWEIADLWSERRREDGQMGDAAIVGLETSFTRMPIKQETIELCEFGGFHPYEMSDYGGALVLTGSCSEVMELLRLHELCVQVIGHTTNRKERVILQGNEKRFLERPRRRQYEKTDFKMH